MTATDATKLPELLPCPFCGAAARIEDGDDDLAIDCHHHPECPMIDHEVHYAPFGRDNMIADWNRRAHMDAQAGRTAAPVVTEAQSDVR